MKKLICTMTLAALLCGAAGAANGSYTVTAELSPDITVKIDGVERVFYNAQGKEVHPISYAGTTYVPIRSIGELMDKNVNWDEATSTATIGGTRVTPDATGTPDRNAREQEISLRMEPGYTIVIDGVKRTFYDVNGKQVDPALYNGSIYLPIRAIGEIMGKTVSWNEATETVFLSGGSADGSVTDFDTSNPTKPTNPVNPTQPTGSVTLEQAKQTALDHSGKTASQVTFVKAYQDFDDGRWVYEVEFIVQSGSGYLEYDYEIDASTGKIISYDYDAEGYQSSSSGNSGAGVSVSESTAKQTALNRVPGASASNIYKFKLDFDDGRWEYEGTIVYNQMEYEFTIDANTGSIVEWDVESIYD